MRGKILMLGLGLAFFATPALGVFNVDNGVDLQPRGPIAVNGGWVNFQWSGSTVLGQPFTFTNALPTLFRVTDAYCYGDRFSVSDNGAPVGSTDVPTRSDCGGPANGDAAYADAAMSQGCFILLPGSHSITLGLLSNPFGGGGAWLRADDVTFNPVDCLQKNGVPI